METGFFGRSKFEVSAIGLGCIVGEALRTCRERVVIATKFDYDMENSKRDMNNRSIALSNEPSLIRRSVEDSLRHLRTDRIDRLYQHLVDTNIPIEDMAGCVSQLMFANRQPCKASIQCGTEILLA